MKPRSHPRVLWAFSLAYALAMFHRTAFSELASALADDGAWSASSLAWVGSAFFWCYLGFQIPAGLLVDALGARRIGPLGCAAMGLGAALLAAADAPATMALGRGLCAVGGVSVFLALIAECAGRSDGRASSALGQALLVGNLGGIAAGVPLSMALSALPWRTLWWLLAGASAVATIALWRLARPAPVREPLRAALRRAVPAIGQCLQHAPVFLAAGALGGLAGAFHGFAGFGLGLLCQTRGISAQGEGLLVSTMVLGFAIGAWLWGRLGDDAQQRAATLKGAPLAATALWAVLMLAPPGSAAALGALLFVLGALCAAFGTVYHVLDDRLRGTGASGAKAVANCGIALGAAVVQLAQGHLPPAWVALPCMLLAGMGALCGWGLCLPGARPDRPLSRGAEAPAMPSPFGATGTPGS